MKARKWTAEECELREKLMEEAFKLKLPEAIDFCESETTEASLVEVTFPSKNEAGLFAERAKKIIRRHKVAGNGLHVSVGNPDEDGNTTVEIYRM